jgi:hypothetical protein
MPLDWLVAAQSSNGNGSSYMPSVLSAMTTIVIIIML